jgi:CubicO group peptidase (beta-lactamase class C family)
MRDKVFGPLGMKRTTFDFKQAMQGNYARPHDVDVDGKPVVGVMSLNYAVVPARPAGGAWTSARDLSQYVMMELANGKLPDGKRLVSEQSLLARRASNVIVAADIDYGMGLIVDKRWGGTIVSHGGDLAGYHSDMMWLPEYGVGAVILTNSDPGVALRAPFLRKLVELLFDFKPEADAALEVAAKQMDNDRVTSRERLAIPPDADAAGKLAAHYKSDALGAVKVTRKGEDLLFDIGEWASPVASRKNDDGTTSFITIGPTLQGFEFVVGDKDGKRTLIVRDAQHEYVFTEA